MNEDSREIHWRDYEYAHRPRSVDWFWGLGLGSILIAIASIYFGNLLFGLLVIVAALTLGISAIREPKEIDYILADKEVHMGTTTYSYRNLKSFFVDEQIHHNKLILMRNRTFMPEIILTIHDHSAEEVRDFMLDKLPEVEHGEPFLHALGERLGI